MLGGIVILGKIIKSDISNMPKKSLDESLIKEDSDLTFFSIDETENNDTLKALKQSYVTTNYKDETILNLQNSIGKNETPKQLKIKSYKKYNEALELAKKNYITTSLKMVDEAINLNPKDMDILNLKGLLTLLKCDFSTSFESFYTALCYENNELSRRYIDILSENDFKVFLGRYNHAIRFINEDLNQESIYILNNIIEEDKYLIEPYVILSLLYDKLGNINKKNEYLEMLSLIDVDNQIFEKDEVAVDKEVDNKKNIKSKNILYISIILVLLLTIFMFLKKNNENIDKLNSEIENAQEKLDKKDEELDEINKELENEKDIEKEVEIVLFDEEELYFKAIEDREENNTKDAIEKFEQVVKHGKTSKYKSNSMYYLAYIYEDIKDYDNAIKYYEKYIKTYSKDENYYDDACYQLGMIYYENDELSKAKETFKFLRKELPNSMYNNSTIKDIINE